ncbi:hypothetical protein [Petralouisia muris]|uniref:hypothetical protein n=1 Tax=Petralouisia muris TaxID=3032872 RepID=UPI0023B87108|nr:hypothetical protein [Petralouisia muris]
MRTEQIGNIETTQTNWEELSISNDFLFGKVMQNPELCKELLQRILPGLEIDRVEYPELQKNIKPNMDAHGVRLDVYVKDDKEDNSVSMGDKAVKIFLNAKGTLDDVSKELKAFLDYVAGKEAGDSYVKKLEEAVEEAKKNRGWRHEYMTLPGEPENWRKTWRRKNDSQCTQNYKKH